MFVSWNWISELVDTTGVDPKAFAERFTLSVAEIEEVVEFGAGLSAVVVAEVVKISPHPNADKLRLADCDLGDRQVQVVCGAPDLKVGMRVPFVPPGVTLPSGITVRHGEVRGVPSPGMLASEADLGLSEDHDGLMELDGCDAPTGTPLPTAIALHDVLYEVDNKSITHRPDLWGQVGMAREVAALLNRPLKPLDITGLTFGDTPPLDVAISAHGHCRRYLCTRLDGVTIAPSPVAARLRLRSLGVRPINNIVDATNLAMLETGNPLHAFDASSVRGDQLIIRQAVEGEQLETLDGETRHLAPTDCVITDEQGPVALAGIMGGANSEIVATTTGVVLEAASFDGAAIRKTATRLGMRTDSSARFEKHLDPETARLAALRFCKMVLELCPDAQITASLLDKGAHIDSPPAPVAISTSRSYLRSRLGLNAEQLSDAWMDRAFSALAFELRGEGDELVVTVPSFRAGRDVGIAEDLVEELGRVFGYDHIPSEAPQVAARPPYLPPSKLQERAARQALAQGRGLTEVVLYSFESEPFRKRAGLVELSAAGHAEPRLRLANHLSADQTHLRRLLCNNLLSAMEDNLLQGNRAAEGHKGLTIGLFELSRAFVPLASNESAHPAADPGLPPALTDSTARQGYLDGLSDALREGATAALKSTAPLPWQPRRLAIALGERLGGGQQGLVSAPKAVSVRLFREAVGAVEDLCRQLQRPAPQFKRQPSVGQLPDGLIRHPGQVDLRPAWLHTARHATIAVDGRFIGLVSLIHPEVRSRLGVPAEVALVELDLDALLDVTAVPEQGEAPPKFPPSAFDLTVPCQPSVRADDLRGVLAAAGDGVVDGVSVDVQWVSEYADEGTDAFGRALTFNVTSRNPDGSLTDDNITQIRRALLGSLLDHSQVRDGWAQDMITHHS
ncbi:MAG: phenylalanine--tRNA ligase subunit beta [Myxococcales bacterium]|nr:phenylalanine--tRNA ligase subunit beta [Myxococcales bacterium]